MNSIVLEVYLKNLIYNYKLVKKINKKIIVAAVVKSNAYGIGIKTVSENLFKIGCKDFFVATIDEGVELRKLLKYVNIYILNGILKDDINKIVKFDLIPVINNYKDYKLISKIKYNIKIILHYDTGMNRLGLNKNEIIDINDKISRTKIRVKYVISHLVSAENKKDKYNNIQLLKTKKLSNILKSHKFSLANSAGIFLGNKFLFDMVRLGISLYGGYGNNKIKKKIKNIIKLKAKIIQIKKIHKNDTIGYNHTYKAKNNGYIATIAIGYADGISRNLSNKGWVYYKNFKASIIGNISMDTLIIDITRFYKKIKIGDYVEIINNKNDIEKIALISGTVSQNIITSFGKRVKIKYIK